jgi:sarcosine oxidase subunit beta
LKTITDIVIVGAGVMGCSTAFHLARLGTRVIVVEKGSIASGMTKRSGGLVVAHYPLQVEARLALASLRYFQDWSNIVGGSCEFTQTGFVRVVGGETQARELNEHVARLRSIGVNTQTLTRAELKELQTSSYTDDITLAAYEPEAGFVDSMAATQSLAARAKALGCKFQTGTLVKSIRVENGRVFGVETNAGPIQALTVVVMAGPWSDRLLKPLGAGIGLVSLRAQVAFFDRPAEFKSGHVAFSDGVTGAYFRPHSYGLTLGGLNAPHSTDPVNPDHIDETVDPGFVADVQNRIAGRLPGMARARYVRGHAGVYDVTPDGHAVLDRVPGIHGLVVAAGFNGTGFGLAPAVGASIAELVTDGEVRSVDLTDLNLARFANSDKGAGEQK